MNVSQRMPRLVVPKLTQVAEGMPCLLQMPFGWSHGPETTVWCHSNQSRHGKGGSMKAHDPFGAFGCSHCHAELDQGRQFTKSEKDFMFAEAMTRTRIFLLEKKVAIPQLEPLDLKMLVTDDDYWLASWRRMALAIDQRAARAVRHYR